jgi:hypothetical protein
MQLRYIVAVALVPLSSSVFAQWDINGSVSASLSGSDDIAWGVAPRIGAGYKSKSWAIDTQLSTLFNDETDSVFDSWQSSNSLQWQSASNLLTTRASWNRVESTANILVDYQFGGGISLIQTPTLNHQFQVTHRGNEQTFIESAALVKDASNMASVSSNWRSSPHSTWQLSSTWSQFESGANTVTLGLQNSRNISRYLVNLSLNSNWAENEVETNNLGGGLSVQRSFTLFDTAVSLNRSQTDTLSFLNVEGFELEIEQQNQILTDQVQFSISDVALWKAVVASFNYQWATTQNLFEVSEFDVDTKSRNEFQSGSFIIVARPNAKSSWQIANTRSKTNGDVDFDTKASWVQQLNSSWRLGVDISKSWSGSDLNWAASLNYQL